MWQNLTEYIEYCTQVQIRGTYLLLLLLPYHTQEYFSAPTV